MAAAYWGTAIAWDSKGSNYKKWQRIRNRELRTGESQGLSGAALEKAVAGIALADPSLVRVQGAP